tara:strand:- start:2399 stop:2527 length:129 start_codon:yes stop_codon:yes gene_type:complete
MIKKILLIASCIIFIFSCGKKADPEYKETKNNKDQSVMHNVL